MAKPKKGDTVVVSKLGGLYKHYGVYAGKGKVIHNTDKGVSKVSVEKFCNGSPGFYVEPSKNRKKSIKQAKSKIGEKGYNLVTNNCEHFSNSCSTGKKKSKQVENFAKGAAKAAAAVAIGVAVSRSLSGSKK